MLVSELNDQPVPTEAKQTVATLFSRINLASAADLAQPAAEANGIKIGQGHKQQKALLASGLNQLGGGDVKAG